MKQTNDLGSLLRLAYEVEGLLLLAADRDGDTGGVMSLLAEKVAMLQAGVMELPYAGTPAGVDDDDAMIASSAMLEEADDADLPAAMPEPVQEPQIAGTTVTVEETVTAPETLDERIARERAADISKAFTLNDKFRYCRALFHGSETEFKDTLDTISGMSGFDEAEEYFYEDLCWDPGDDDVKAFMEIVKRHF